MPRAEHRSPVAQLAEHPAVNRRVVGSSPTRGVGHGGNPVSPMSPSLVSTAEAPAKPALRLFRAVPLFVVAVLPEDPAQAAERDQRNDDRGEDDRCDPTISRGCYEG